MIATGGASKTSDSGSAVRVRRVLPGETGEIALALITGERGGISAATNNAFKNSGLFHILSISGLHMVIAAGAVFYSVRLLLAAIPLFALTLPIKKIAAVIGILSAIAYLAISGGAFATVRSALMILIIFGAVLLDRPALALRNVALAAFLILAVYPESLLDAGFQMSFAAVTALIASHEIMSRFLGAGSKPNPFFEHPEVLRRDRRFDADRERRRRAIRRLQLPSEPAVRRAREHDRDSDLQHHRDAGGAGGDGADADRARGSGLKPMGWGIEGMTWCANAGRRSAGRGRAHSRNPDAGVRADARRRHVAGALADARRLAGAALVLLGLVVAPWMPRPDILVAQNGSLVAVRDASGKLASLAPKGSKYDLERWLEYDGDGRSASEAQRCDRVHMRCDGLCRSRQRRDGRG